MKIMLPQPIPDSLLVIPASVGIILLIVLLVAGKEYLQAKKDINHKIEEEKNP